MVIFGYVGVFKTAMAALDHRAARIKAELDEAALFYLRARGIDQTTARDLLVSAFLSGAIEEVRDDAVAEALRGRIGGWLNAMRANREAAK